MRRQSRIRRRPVVTPNTITWVGMDAHKNSIAVAALFPDRLESVEWTEATTPEAIRRLARKLRREAPGEVRCCYEAGPTGYALHRQLDVFAVGRSGIYGRFDEGPSQPGSPPHLRSSAGRRAHVSRGRRSPRPARIATLRRSVRIATAVDPGRERRAALGRRPPGRRASRRARDRRFESRCGKACITCFRSTLPICEPAALPSTVPRSSSPKHSPFTDARSRQGGLPWQRSWC